jgi:very-short-patch-repair endonuclease
MKNGNHAKIPAYEWLRQNKNYTPNSEIPIAQEAKQGFSAGLFKFIEDGYHGFWQPEDYGDGHCDPERFSLRVAERYSELTALADEPLGSPIEWRLGACLLWMQCDWAGFPSVDLFDGPEEHIRLFGAEHEHMFFYLCPQAGIAGFRVDFLIYFMLGKKYKGLVVECDGHAFHEKNKEQASRDKARDRAILAAGFPVIRFTGSDIHNRTLECVEEVQSILSGILDGMRSPEDS